MTSPSYLKILIAQAEADKITLLKQRIDSIKGRTELEKQVNGIANQIAGNTPSGYAAIDSLREIMEKLAMAEVFQDASVGTEASLNNRIDVFQKAYDATLERRALKKLKVPESRLNAAREREAAASAHVHRILDSSPNYIYSD